MASRMRWTARVGVTALAIGLAVPTAWAATWSPGPDADKDTATATAQYSWNYGSAAAKLKNGKIVLGYATDGDSNTSSKQSVYTRVGTVGAGDAVTWAKPKLVSPKAQISDRITVASGKSNNNIYATWASQTGYNKQYDPDAPRATWFRAFIAGSGWTAPTRLSPATGRVDYPVVAASGNNVYIAYTNSDTGAVLLRTSTNAGTSWNSTTVGQTSREDGGLGSGPEGLGAWPGTCAAGSNVGVVWLDGSGDVKLSVSEANGAGISTKTIATTSDAGGDDEGWAQCDAAGSRIGVTWNQDDGVYYSEYSTGTDSFTTAATKAVAIPGGGYAASYGGSVALDGSSAVGIAAPMCVQDGCDYSDSTVRIDLRWVESSNKGGAGTWGSPEALSNSSVAGKPLNDSPSPLFYDANTRFVIYNGWNAGYTNYRLYLATGAS